MQLNVSGSGEVTDAGALVDAIASTIASQAPGVNASISVTQTATVSPADKQAPGGAAA